MMNNIRVILVNTFHPGNIGAAARAMKTMGLSDLALVAPEQFPHPEASSRAAGAVDVLDTATIYDSLAQALADRTLVFAASARGVHQFAPPQLEVVEAAKEIARHPQEKIAIVFGRERDGLSQQEINLCDRIVYIEGNPDYSVLNVSAAVQIICYEVFKQSGRSKTIAESQPLLASKEQLENFYAIVERELTSVGYLNPAQPSNTMKRLRTLLAKAQPDRLEINLLTGIVKALRRAKG